MGQYEIQKPTVTGTYRHRPELRFCHGKMFKSHFYRRSVFSFHLSISFLSVLLADRTNGRAIATLFRLSVRLSSVTLCIVAKRCVLEQKLLLRAYRKSYMRNRLVPK